MALSFNECVYSISEITACSTSLVEKIVASFNEIDDRSINEIITLITNKSIPELEEWLSRHPPAQQQKFSINQSIDHEEFSHSDQNLSNLSNIYEEFKNINYVDDTFEVVEEEGDLINLIDDFNLQDLDYIREMNTQLKFNANKDEKSIFYIEEEIEFSQEELFEEREFECSICSDWFLLSEMYTVSCINSHRFCKNCTKQHVDLKLNEKMRIRCPGYQCDYVLSPLDLTHIGYSNEIVKDYDNSLNIQFLQDNAVGCPTADCPGYIIPSDHDRREEHDCAICGFVSCTLCKKMYHYRTECNQVEEIEARWRSWIGSDRNSFPLMSTLPKINNEDVYTQCSICNKQINVSVRLSCLNCKFFEVCLDCDRLGLGELHGNHVFIIIGDVQAKKHILDNNESEKVIEVTAKDCPKCKRKVVKDGGCRHLKCHCGHEFFWCCLRAYRIREEASAHYKNCPD